MAYKVEFPPDIEKPSSSVSLLIKTGDSGDRGDQVTEGPIVAVKIASTVLSADIWLAFRDDFQPEEGEPLAVFYSHELSFLSDKTPEELREIHKVKLAFGPGSRVRQ